MRASILLLTCLLTGVACAPRSAAPAAAPPQGAAPGAAGASAAAPSPVAPTRITFAYSTSSAANSPLQLAQDRGIFRENGLDVELVHALGNAGPAAVLSGQAQILSSGCAEVVSAVAGGAEFVILATTINRMQYVLAGGPNIPNAESVRGKRLAVSRLGASSHLATKFIVKHLRLDPDRDVEYLQVGNTPERVSALLAGSVDGSILSIDEGQLIGNQPGMRIIVDMTAENVPYCGNALVATRQYVRENPEVIRRLTRAVVETIARFKVNKAEGMEAVGRFLDEQDMQKVEGLWNTWANRMFPEKPYPDPQGLQFVIDEVAYGDERARTLTTDQMIDQSWLRELDQSGYIDGLYRAGGAR